MIRRIIIILVWIATLPGCQNKTGKEKDFGRLNPFEDKNVVVTAFALRGTFFREFESNGRLEAVRKAILTYELDEEILSVEVKSGQRVAEGQTLSALDQTSQLHNYEKACRAVDKARLELEDDLIGMGYQLKDSLSVPPHFMKIALVRSGYADAQGEKELARIRLGKTRVTAPFPGVIAGLEARAFNRSGQYREFCTLIDDSSFEVEFPVLESEAAKLHPGMPVVVIPFAFDSDTVGGVLSAVNPSVSEAGMILATALVKNVTGRLIDGMNVKVVVRDPVPDQVIIPKSAVTLRQERKVVFVCKNDTAHWRYVNVGEENARFCTIRGDDVKPGEEVITDGNFNLSHLSPVVKMEQ